MKLPQFTIPFVMTCQVTGLQKAFTSRAYIENKLRAFKGNMQRMLDTYVCDDAKRLLREGKTVRQVNLELDGKYKYQGASKIDLSTLILDRRMSRENYRQGALHRKQGRRQGSRSLGARHANRRPAGRRQLQTA